MGDLRRRAWTIRRYGPSLTSVLLLSVWPRAGLAETPPEPAPASARPAAEIRDTDTDLKNLPKPLDALIEATRLEQDRLAAEHHALDQLLPRNREYDRALARSRELLRARDYEAVIETLQAILDAPDDCFTRGGPPEGDGLEFPTDPDSEETAAVDKATKHNSTATLQPSPRSTRRAAEEILSDIPETLTLYRRTYEPFATALLTDARAGDKQAARTLLTRFRLTIQAIDYQLQRASVLVDAGRADEARLILAEVSEHRALPATHLKRITNLVQCLPTHDGGFGATEIKLVSASAGHSAGAAASGGAGLQPAANGEWTEPSGSSTGANSFAAIGPVLSPQWTLRHDECLEISDDPRSHGNNSVLSAIRRWEAEQMDHGSDAGPIGPQSVVISGDRIVYSDYEGLVARRLSTGEKLWHLPSPGSIRASLDEMEDAGDRGLLESRLTIDSVSSELTSDGEHVYWVERIPLVEGNPLTRLVAVRIDNGNRVWVHDPNVAGDIEPGTASHLLSAPTPTAEGLIAAVETHGQIELRSLDAATGRTKWSQSIAVADVPATEDRLRMLMSCRPVVASGRIICGTQLGTIVAVDSQTGTLCWIYNYADVTAGRGGRPRSVASREFNTRAFANPPIVSGEIVYAMPIQSADIVAISLNTGAELWKTQRENDLTISMVDEARGQLVISGDRFVRALSLTDGSERWRVRVPAIVGRGIGIGDELMLPTASRNLLRIDLVSGSIQDDRWDRAARPAIDRTAMDTGNLAIVNDYVVRNGPLSISVMPRSEMVVGRALETLKSGDGSAAVAAKVDLARVALASQKPAESLRWLSDVTSEELDKSLKPDFEHLLRETLFASLPNKSSESIAPNATFQQLRALARTPGQAARVMKHRIATAVQRGDFEDAIAVSKQLAALTDGARPGILHEEALRVASPQLAGSLLASLTSQDLETLGVADEAERLAWIDPTTGLAPSDQDLVQQRTDFLAMFGQRPEAGMVRLAHASTLLEQGQLQAAELQYLLAIRDGNDQARVHGRLALAGLYTRHHMAREAANVWEELIQQSPDRHIGSFTVSELAEHISEKHPVARALRQRRPFPTADYAGSISYATHDLPDWAQWYSEAQPKMSPFPGAGIDVIDTGKLGDTPSISQLLFINQETAQIRGRVQVPAYYWHPPSRVHRRAGHVLPLGYYDPVAVSLLENRPLWNAEESSLWTSIEGNTTTTENETMVAVRNRIKVKVGPVHPDACVLQQRNRLFAVDPLTGEMLWSRSDLDRSSGLLFDESAGIVGDSKRTTVFDSDGVGYQIFSTQSGELIERGRLAPRGVHVRRYRLAGSRRVLLITRIESEYRYQVWDSHAPGKDPEIDIVAGPTLLVDQAESGRVGVVDADNTFQLIDLENGRTVLSCKLPKVDWDHAAGLNIIEQDAMVFVDVALSNSPMASQLQLSSSTVRIPSRPIGGNLTAIRANSDGVGEVAWSADLGRSTILSGSDYRLPVLLVAARIRPDSGGPERMKLTILRTADGEELAQHLDLPRTPLWRWDYDIDNRRVELYGPETTITVRFGGIADVVKNRSEPQETKFVSIER